jgi:hypothetical protein
MDMATKNYLLECIEDCKTGMCRWDDAAWSFIVNITNENDASLFTLATPEIESEVLRRIDMLHTDGHYIAHLAHVGDIDSTDVIQKLEALLIKDGFIPKPSSQ